MDVDVAVGDVDVLAGFVVGLDAEVEPGVTTTGDELPHADTLIAAAAATTAVAQPRPRADIAVAYPAVGTVASSSMLTCGGVLSELCTVQCDATASSAARWSSGTPAGTCTASDISATRAGWRPNE